MQKVKRRKVARIQCIILETKIISQAVMAIIVRSVHRHALMCTLTDT